MSRIIVDVKADGTVQVETKGFSGKSCLEASKFVEEALGQKISEKHTEEFYTDREIETDVNVENYD